jgi:hypothetical protein
MSRSNVKNRKGRGLITRERLSKTRMAREVVGHVFNVPADPSTLETCSTRQAGHPRAELRYQVADLFLEAAEDFRRPDAALKSSGARFQRAGTSEHVGNVLHSSLAFPAHEGLAELQPK